MALYFGLGAYRVGTGDGGANEDSTSQWSTGSALAKQVETLRAQGAGGLGALPVRLPVRELRPGAGRRRAGGPGPGKRLSPGKILVKTDPKPRGTGAFSCNAAQNAV